MLNSLVLLVCLLCRQGSVVVTFQATLNLGASSPTAAQQAATDALVAGVLSGVQSAGLAGYNVSATNYSVVANFSSTTTNTSSSSTTTATTTTTTATTSTSKTIPVPFL